MTNMENINRFDLTNMNTGQILFTGSTDEIQAYLIAAALTEGSWVKYIPVK